MDLGGGGRFRRMGVSDQGQGLEKKSRIMGSGGRYSGT